MLKLKEIDYLGSKGYYISGDKKERKNAVTKLKKENISITPTKSFINIVFNSDVKKVKKILNLN